MAQVQVGRIAKGVCAGLILCTSGLYAFLGDWEGGQEFTVYADRLAGGLPTVCRGLTKYVTRTPIVVGDVWSEDKCEREERAAIVKVQLQLSQCFKVKPTQSVFDAATSHAWNFGASATCGSSAMAAWNRGDWSLGCRRLYQSDDGRPVWSYAKTGRLIVVNGKVVPERKLVRGLANRRVAEARMCEAGE